VLLSIHVPKNAGTSFRLVIDRLYGSEVWYNYGAIFSRDSARPGLIPEGTRIIHGHFLADAFDDLLPSRRYITWVRHPVERLVSNYHHFLRSPDMRDTCCRLLHENNLDLRQFADLDWMQNEACRYLANKPIEDFEFVGVSEQFDASIELFCSMFGVGPVEECPCVNVNPGRATERYTLPEEDFAYILERNQADMAWYNRAVSRLATETRRASARVA